MQIALSANLTLVFVLLLVGAVTIVFQIKNKQFFTVKNTIIYIFHFALIGFWVKYAFFLQENGALYYGSGASYWETTFRSLIDTVLVNHFAAYSLILLLFAALFLIWTSRFFKNKTAFLFKSSFAISFFMLFSLVIAFYLLKIVFHVNYPEDRTGLFFYVLLMLSFAFVIDENESKFNTAFIVIPLFFIIHFAFTINFSKHAWGFYETMPKRFYETLLSEQSKNKEPISIGGHRVLELFYSYYNYNSNNKLNHMVPPELMEMNCDYFVTWKKDKPYYDKYYNELDHDKNWDMVLLKRKTPIQRHLIHEMKEEKELSGNEEFYTFFERTDTLFTSPDPIMAEFDISVERTPVPFNAWLVLQVDSVNGGPQIYFRRTPLNWIKYNWNGTEHLKTCIQTDRLPLHHCRLVAFLWNMDKKEIEMKINSVKLYHLNAEGITEASKAK